MKSEQTERHLSEFFGNLFISSYIFIQNISLRFRVDRTVEIIKRLENTWKSAGKSTLLSLCLTHKVCFLPGQLNKHFTHRATLHSATKQWQIGAFNLPHLTLTKLLFDTHSNRAFLSQVSPPRWVLINFPLSLCVSIEEISNWEILALPSRQNKMKISKRTM